MQPFQKIGNRCRERTPAGEVQFRAMRGATDDVRVTGERPRESGGGTAGEHGKGDCRGKTPGKDRQAMKLCLDQRGRDVTSWESKHELFVDSKDGVVPARSEEVHRRRR